jgi:hypothetical protein
MTGVVVVVVPGARQLKPRFLVSNQSTDKAVAVG